MSQARKERRLAKKQFAKVAARRECGECSVCCTLLGVPELVKPRGQKCLHECGPKGCAIYEQRPKPCRDFNCLWRQGLFSEALRPDRLGVMFTVTNEKSRYGRQLTVVREVEEGAIERAMPILQVMAKEIVLVLITDFESPRRIMGPEHEVAAIQEFARRQLPVTE